MKVGDLVLWMNYQYNIYMLCKNFAYIGFNHIGKDGQPVFIKDCVLINQLKPTTMK